jgi:hypothetical protein
MTYVLIMILAQGPAMQEFNSKKSCEQAIIAIAPDVYPYGIMECVPK